MKINALKVFMRHAFVVLPVTCVLVLACLLINIIKRIEHNVQAYNVVPGSPQIRSMSLVLKDCKVAFILLIVMIGIMGFFLFSYIFVMRSSGRREMHLCNTLIKQMEATQQAERKSMNKSLAFATASHDIRAALAGITGLIDISKDEVSPGSELETNLRQMETCAKDLFGLLNSILDTSKIEAGKMQLEEEEFNVAQLVEDVVDLYHPVGFKKGIDVVLDPHDGSLIKFPRAIGDRGRLKQILCNLISNAVKFTLEGHVTIRAWVEKPSFKNSIAASGKSNGVARQLLYLFNKNNKAQADMGTMKHDPNSLEFVFEVDDTGKGIPEEKHKSVFENYVQVKETALGEGGTGLGLGIVQSLVRLMHGEIGIVDKEMGERGTCFRFNVLLTVPENVSKDSTKEVDIEMGFGPTTSDLGIVATHTPSTPGLSIHTPSPRLNIRTPCSTPKVDGSGSSVVLLIKNEERRRISQKFMENLGIKVFVADQWEQLSHTLEKATKHKGGYHSCHHSSSGRSELGLQDCLSKSTSCNSSNRVKEVPLINSMDKSGTENNNILPLSLFKKTSLRGATGFVLVVIDATVGPLSELCKIVTEFKMWLHHQNSTRNCNWCRVVWLKNNSINLDHPVIFDPEDVIKHKALHGSRLYEVVKLLPEFGGALPKRRPTFQQLPHQVGKASIAPASPSRSYSNSSYHHQLHHTTDDEIEVLQDHGIIGGSSGNDTPHQKISSPALHTHQYPSQVDSSTSRNSSVPVPHGDQMQEHVGDSNRPLSGMRFLVAEDSPPNRKVVEGFLKKMGAIVELCGNGREALDLVRGALANQGKHGFDYILMDCEMPEMDGFEATRQIRKEEEPYNLHIPIIALTGHAPNEEGNRTSEAGMDDHLSKPFNMTQLLEIVRRIDNTNRHKSKEKS